MPANRKHLGEWHEPPFLGRSHDIEATPDDRVFDFSNENDVATALVETNPDINVYAYLVDETELRELALESARAIITSRQEVFMEHKLAQEFNTAKEERDKKGVGHLAVVACWKEDLHTGEVELSTMEVPRSKVSA